MGGVYRLPMHLIFFKMDKSIAFELAKEHAGKSDVIYVTSDKNVFFKQHKYAAEFHAKEKNLQVFEFTADDFSNVSKAETPENVKPPKKAK